MFSRNPYKSGRKKRNFIGKFDWYSTFRVLDSQYMNKCLEERYDYVFYRHFRNECSYFPSLMYAEDDFDVNNRLECLRGVAYIPSLFEKVLYHSRVFDREVVKLHPDLYPYVREKTPEITRIAIRNGVCIGNNNSSVGLQSIQKTEKGTGLPC